jgi:hypothetical protein
MLRGEPSFPISSAPAAERGAANGGQLIMFNVSRVSQMIDFGLVTLSYQDFSEKWGAPRVNEERPGREIGRFHAISILKPTFHHGWGAAVLYE